MRTCPAPRPAAVAALALAIGVVACAPADPPRASSSSSARLGASTHGPTGSPRELDCKGAPAPLASFVGEWVGTRPFDASDALAHRGPTVVWISANGARLHLTEGVGAVAYDVDLDVSAGRPLASGSSTSTKTELAVQTGETRARQITIQREVAVAACVQGDRLTLARVMETRGDGLRTLRDDDVVQLQRKPPPPTFEPPAGFVVLADAQTSGSLALAPGRVVWSTMEGLPAKSAIRTVPRAGGPTRELASGLDVVHALAVHGDHVYIAEHARVSRVALDGGPVEGLVSVAADGLAVTNDAILIKAFDGAIYSTPLTGGDLVPLMKPIENMTLGGMAVDGAWVYVATRRSITGDSGELLRLSVRGGAPRAIASDTICGDLTARGGEVWWGTCDGSLLRGKKRIAAGQGRIASIAVVGDAVWFALGEGRGEIRRMDGERVVTVMKGDFDPERIAIDPEEPDTLYVLDRGFTSAAPRGRIGKVRGSAHERAASPP